MRYHKPSPGLLATLSRARDRYLLLPSPTRGRGVGERVSSQIWGNINRGTLNNSKLVTPAKAGVQINYLLDARLRRHNDLFRLYVDRN